MADNATTTVDTTESGATTNTQPTEQNTKTMPQTQADPNQKTYTLDEIQKLIQSESDKKNADYGKRISDLLKEVEGLKKDKMNADELKKYEDEKKAKEIAEKDRLLTERENRLTAIDELTKVKLYDGSDNANAFVDIVINGANADVIAANVKAVKAYIDEQVVKGVDETFRTNGREPNGGSKGTGTSKDNNIAAKLGEQAAERTKKSNDTLSHYGIGGNK